MGTSQGQETETASSLCMVGAAPDGIVKCMDSVIELFIRKKTRVINCHIINNPVRAGAAE